MPDKDKSPIDFHNPLIFKAIKIFSSSLHNFPAIKKWPVFILFM